MDKREEFLKLGYKKEVLKEILGIIENNTVSQPVEIFLFKDGKLFDLTCDDASFFEEIVVNSVREFMKELESDDLAEVQSYEDSIYDKFINAIKPWRRACSTSLQKNKYGIVCLVTTISRNF